MSTVPLNLPPLTDPRLLSLMGSPKVVTPQGPTQPLPIPAGTAISALNPGPAPTLAALPQAQSNPLSALGAPDMPQVVAPPGTIQGDMANLQRLTAGGSGIHQIFNPVDDNGNPTNQPVSAWRKLGGIGATIGDTLLRIAAPKLEAMIPGTEGNQQYELGKARQIVTNDEANNQGQANIGQTQANTSYLQQKPEIEQSKIDQKQTAVQERVGQAAAARGQTVSWGADGLPVFSDDIHSQAYADHQALSAMHQATADKSALVAEQLKNHYIPGTPEWDEYQRKMAQVDKRLQVAVAGLGLRAQGLDLRRQNTEASLYGTDESGNPLPGAPQITDDQGNVQVIGSKNAGHAIAQQKAVGSFNDLSGSNGHTRNALIQLYQEGGSLSDPRVVAAMSDPNSTIGKVINGKLVQGGLSPTEITAINAVRQLHEQAGILRSTTGGTSSEAGAQRILDVVPSAGDSNAVALSKLDEQEAVLRRLSPGMTGVSGGLSVRNRTPPSGTYKMTASGVGNHKIGSNDGGVTWFDVSTGKPLQ
jgi:hypothetical protein